MPKKTEAKTATKRTKVKDLSKSERRLDQKEMKRTKGGVVGPCGIKRPNS